MKLSAILTYHSIDRSGSVISTTPEVFRKQMEILAEAEIPVVPLSQVQQTRGSVALTFDDGFANFEDHALRVLDQYRFPAVVFLVSAYCGGLNTWASPSTPVPRLPLMSWPTIRKLNGGLVEWGAHSVTHPDLATIPQELAEAEIRDSRAAIEDHAGVGVKAFAYPYGSLNGSARAAVSRHFDLACGTRLRYLNSATDMFDMPRLDMYYFREPARMRTIFRSSGRLYTSFRRMLREGRTWLSR